MTTPGGYSAGSIFLSVVPVFDDFHDRVKKKTREVQDEIDKDHDRQAPDREQREKDRGRKDAKAYAGAYAEAFKRSVKGAKKEVASIKIDVNDAAAVARLAAINKSLEALENVDIGVDVTAGEARSEIRRLTEMVRRLQAENVNIDVRADANAVLASLAALDAATRRLDGRDIDIDVRLDTDRAQRNLGSFLTKLRASVAAALSTLPDLNIDADSSDELKEIAEIRAQLEALDRASIEPDFDLSGARVEIAEIEARLQKLGLESVDIQVSADTLGASAALAKVRLEAARIDKMRVDIRVDADTHPARRAFREFKAELANGSSLRAFSGILLAIIAILPLLIPLLAGATAGIAALGVAAGAAAVGVGVAVLAFSGIGAAVKAYGKVEDNAAKDALAAGKTLRNAAKAVRDAEQGVARARESGARSAEDAARRVSNAVRGQADAQRQASKNIQQALDNQAKAEKNLAKAQKDALKAQQAVIDARKEAQAEAADLEMALRQNQLDERQGVIDLFQRTVSDINTRQDGGATNLDKEQSDLGLEQARLSLERIRAEGDRLRSDQAKGATTGVDGSQKVQDAAERLQEALERQRDAVLELGEAQKGVDEARVESARIVADANRAVSDALREQGRAAADSAISVRDAQERLSDAQMAQAEAVKSVTELGSASAQELAKALAKLSPAGQEFARYLAGLKQGFYDIRNAAQEGMLPGVQAAFQQIIDVYGPRFEDFVSRVATRLGSLFERGAGALTTDPVFTEFFAQFGAATPDLIEGFSTAIGGLLEILASLATAFLPFSDDFLGGLNDLIDAGGRWAASLAGSEGFQSFLDYVKTEGKQALGVLGKLVLVLVHLGEGLAPYADKLLDLFLGFLDFLLGIPAPVLGALTAALVAVVFAIQVLLGIAGAITAITGALGVMSILGAALSAVAATIAALSAPVLIVIALIAALVVGLVILYTKSETFRDIINAAFRMVGEYISWVYNTLIKPVFDFLVGYLKFLYEVWREGFKLVADIFSLIFSMIGAAWTAFSETGPGKFIVGYLTLVADAWSAVTGRIAKIWGGMFDGLKGAAKEAIKFIVDTVLNGGLIKAFNWIADKVGSDAKITPIALPSSFYNNGTFSNANDNGSQYRAAGGFITGYSPTDTADNILANVTAGEYVIPVAATRRLRARFGDGFLEQLRQGLPSFAGGGLVPAMQKARSYVVDTYGITNIGGYANRNVAGTNKKSKHASGQALDIMTRNIPLGNRIALDFAYGDAHRLFEIASTIWQQAISTNGRPFKGMKDRGSPTQNHRDHVHVDTGGGGKLSAFSGVGSFLSALVDYAGSVIPDPMKWVAEQTRATYAGVKDSALGNLGISAAENVGGLVLNNLSNILANAGDFAEVSAKGATGFAKFLGGGGIPGLVGRKVAGSLFDSGGWLQPGITQVMNASGKPEPVFSASQWDVLARQLDGNKGGDTYNANVTAQQQNDPSAVAEAVLFAHRRIAAGGKYAGGRV